MRRQWVLDGKDGKDELTFQEALRKKYRARRQRVCHVHLLLIFMHTFYFIESQILFPQKFYNRTAVVKPSEMIHWKLLTLEYMTEESDDPDDDNVIIEHKLQWRSDSKCLIH